MAMAKFTVDTTNKLFIAKAGVTSFDAKVDLYSDAKEHWITDDTANKFTFPFISPTTGRTTVQGGPDIDAAEGTSIPTYLYLEGGWRIRPDEADHTLKVSGAVLLVQGGGDPFVDTLGAFTVRINYQQPVQAIGVATAAVIAPTQQQIRDAMALGTAEIPASGSIDEFIETIAARVARLFQMRGLDAANPVDFKKDGSVSFDDVVISSEDIANGKRVTRTS